MWKSVIAALVLALVTAHAHAEPYDWRTIPFQGGGFVQGLLYHPKQKDILYARTDVGGMYSFDFAQDRWQPLMDGFGRDDWDCFGVLSFAVDPNAADRVYATCGLYLSDRVPDAGVLRSDDRGRHWQKTTLKGVRLGGNAIGRGTGERLQVDPTNGDILWLGTSQNGLLKSTDRGVSFSRVIAFTPKSVTTVLITGSTIYAGSGETGDGLYKSNDGGQTFARVDGSPHLVPHQMALDADGRLYVTFADGPGPHDVADGAVWKLKDNLWTDISPAHPTPALTFGYSGLDIDRQHPGTLVVTTSDRYPGLDDIYLSHDGGATWKPVKPQASHHTETHSWLTSYMSGHDKDGPNRRDMGHWMDAVKINPFNADELIYGTGYGVWRTRNLHALDRGETVDFAFADDNLEETVILGLEAPPKGPRVLMAAGDVGGAAFTDLDSTPTHGLFTPENKTNQSVAFAALKPNIIVRSVDDELHRGFISTDSGETWQPLPSVPPPIATADWGAYRAGKLTISATGHNLVWVPENEPAYHSDDLGKTWSLSAGWPDPARGQEVIADPMDDATFYALDRAASRVLVSHDAGSSFSTFLTLPSVSGGQLRAVPGRRGELWLALSTGLQRIVEGKPQSIPGVDAAWQVTFGKAAPGRRNSAIFIRGKVRGEEGLWRSDDTGATWVRINDAAHRFGQMRAIAGDPRHWGVLYIAPDGRGVMVGQPR